MKSGETRFIVKKLDTKKPYNSVGFRLSNGKTTIKKSTDAEDTKDKVLVQDGVFLIPLQQTDTQSLEGNVTLEAQINYENHSVRKSDDNFMFVGSTLGTDLIQDSEPAQDDGIEVVMTAIEEGVAVIVNPEASQELIDAVTRLFQDTKQIAQSVRDDADAGEFDGFSPQVTVKTETPSTYVLHIKDADHEFDTPNLQGQGEGGTSDYEDLSNKPRINNIELIGNKTTSDLGLDLEVGDGLKREGNVVSVDLKSSNSFLDFASGKLGVDFETLGIYEPFRSSLTNTNYETPLVSKSYIDNGFYTKSEVDTALGNKQNTLTDVNGILIGTDNTIGIYRNSPQGIPNYLTFYQGGVYIDTYSLSHDRDFRQGLKSDGYDHPLQPKLTAGTNITIDSNNVISASGGSYSGGDGIDITNDTISVDLKSGTELQITNDQLDIDLSNYATTTSVSGKQDKTTISTDTTSTTVSLTLADNHEYRYTQDLTSLTLTMPNGDFISSIVFASGSTPTSMTYDSNIKWSGDDVSSNAFVPQANKEYEIVFWYNGLSVNAVVRGVA